MAIHKATTAKEIYRLKASNKNILDLTGRRHVEQNLFIAKTIASKLDLEKNSKVVDVGCGDGRFLEEAVLNGVDPLIGKLIGFLPNVEEVLRVSNHLAVSLNPGSKYITIAVGEASKVALPDSYADVVVCNGVLQGWGMDESYVRSSLLEFFRILSPNVKNETLSDNSPVTGILYIGELPDSNELEERPYGDSIVKWLWWVLREQGKREFLARTRQVLRALLGGDNLIIVPKSHFHIKPDYFIDMLKQCGFVDVTCWKFSSLNGKGEVKMSDTRWNYLALKKS